MAHEALIETLTKLQHGLGFAVADAMDALKLCHGSDAVSGLLLKRHLETLVGLKQQNLRHLEAVQHQHAAPHLRAVEECHDPQ